MQGFLRVLKKIAKGLLIFVLALFVMANLFILFSGRTYLYKGIYNTYLQGKSGPDIYDKDVFLYTNIEPNLQAEAWKKSSMFNRYQLSEAEEKNLAQIGTTSFLVMQADSLIFERYWENHDSIQVSNSFSAAKTVIALLIGIALEEGKIKSLDDSIGKYLPAYRQVGKNKVTIRDLLYMASGLNWEESGKDPFSHNAESYYGSNLLDLVNSLKLVSEPGKIFKYQSGNSQLLGFVLEAATGQNISEYCQNKLWKQIGATSPAHWSLDKEGGDEKAFCCLYATTRDFARVGELILNEGRLGDKQIISEAYMKEMCMPAPLTTEEGIANTRYGMHIWLTTYKGKKVIYCRGILGQYVAAIPEDNLVFVRTGHHRKESYTFAEAEKSKKVRTDMIDHPKDFYEMLEIVDKIKLSVPQ